MNPDDEVCLCFHVTKRKLQNFLRIEQPQRVGQVSECASAGTGCGWCRQYLEVLYRQWREARPADDQGIAATEYAQRRAEYLRRKQDGSSS